jgi:hypothetical protein
MIAHEDTLSLRQAHVRLLVVPKRSGNEDHVTHSHACLTSLSQWFSVEEEAACVPHCLDQSMNLAPGLQPTPFMSKAL